MKYDLYLDESMYIDKNKHTWYCLAGVVIENGIIEKISGSLEDLKVQLWGNESNFEAKRHILHEAEIRNYNQRVLDPGYAVLKQRANVRKAISGVGKIVNEYKLKVFGCVIDETALEKKYMSKQSSYSAYRIGLQIIIENYTHFLKNSDSVGNIILESRRNSDGDIQDVRTRKQFYKIMTHGTLMYTPLDLQNTIYKIAFVQKHKNNAGLQLADFVPRPFLLNNVGVEQKKPSLYQILRKSRYGGNGSVPSEFGVVVYS